MSDAATIGLLSAFVAGLVSFLSPCVAPLVPGYLALISGSATTNSQQTHDRGHRLLLTSLVFVVGFSLVFIALGASVSVFGDLLSEYRIQMARVAGIIMIVMGIALLWGFRFPFLMAERKIHVTPRQFTLSETLLVGMAFGFGWTPCFGPILASILAYTSTVDGVRQGVVLLSAYSMGLGVPFLIAGLGLDRFQRLLRTVSRHMAAVVAASGTALVVIGLVFVSGQVFRISIMSQRFMNQIPGLGSG